MKDYLAAITIAFGKVEADPDCDGTQYRYTLGGFDFVSYPQSGATFHFNHHGIKSYSPYEKLSAGATRIISFVQRYRIMQTEIRAYTFFMRNVFKTCEWKSLTHLPKYLKVAGWVAKAAPKVGRHG